MRKRTVGDHLTVNAISGTDAVLLGFNLRAEPSDNFLGFAVRRTDLGTEASAWLPNLLAFPGAVDGSIITRDHPLQAFLWGDYTVGAGQSLRYEVRAVGGAPGALEIRDAVDFEIETEQHEDGRHGIWFNRGIAGSQAYTRQFGQISPLESDPARRWMSRGLEEAMTRFLRRAEDSGWALRGALYEFSQEHILEEFIRAAARGVDVKLRVAAPVSDGFPKDPSPANIHAIEHIAVDIDRQEHKLGKLTKGRARNDIAHNKFVVLVKDGEPLAVWTGSTNLTEGAFFGHSNVGHLVEDPDIAAKYLRYWQALDRDPSRDELRPFVEQETPLPADGVAPAGEILPIFSPRQDSAALRWYARLMGRAQQALLLSAPFGVTGVFDDLLKHEAAYPRYVLLDSLGKDAYLQRVGPNTHATAGGYIGKGVWRQFLEEHLSGLNVHAKYIHTKYILVDPLTDDPLVITGSANFSTNSTEQNDENTLVIRGDQRVADIYLSEFMRIFTHLQFRAKTGRAHPEQMAPDPTDPRAGTDKALDPTGTWAKAFFNRDDPRFKERELFGATEIAPAE